jgi:glycerophosphoryl diester phosphodiesterase
MKKVLILICGFYLFLYILGFIIPQKITHPVLERLSKPVTIAHQGGNKIYPDESLLAFTNAINMGIQVIEFDIHRTKDGIIVINHDQTIDRLTNGTGLIREMSWVELQQVDGAYNWSPDGLTYPYRDKGIKILSLIEMMDAFPQQLYDIEIKQHDPPLEKDLCDLLRKYGVAADQAIVASFRDETLARFHDICPEVAISLPVNQGTVLYILSRVGLERLLPLDAVVAQLPTTFSTILGQLELDRRYIEAFAKGDRQVWVWTVNDSIEMKRLVKMGAHGIITDRPDILMDFVQ